MLQKKKTSEFMDMSRWMVFYKGGTILFHGYWHFGSIFFTFIIDLSAEVFAKIHSASKMLGKMQKAMFQFLSNFSKQV